ncbi:MAG: lytic transglycosylase domain-containing protein [Clostridiales bacterium]|nr:lytic transglycosylase domain-containing protein [Clostridiales bacterium]
MGAKATAMRTRRPARRGRRLRPAAFLLMTAVFLVAAAAVGRERVLKPPAALVEIIAPLCVELGEELPLVLAVIQVESRFRENAVSPRGAVGLMQVMPDTAGWVAEQWGLEGYTEDKLLQREWNLTIGMTYLRYLRQQFPESLAQALAAYNAGPSRVRSWQSAGEWDGSESRLEDVPYPETKNYVRRVLKAYASYRKIY